MEIGGWNKPFPICSRLCSHRCEKRRPTTASVVGKMLLARVVGAVCVRYRCVPLWRFRILDFPFLVENIIREEDNNNSASGCRRRLEDAISNMFSFVLLPMWEKETHNSKCCGKTLGSFYASFLFQMSLCTPLAVSDLGFSVLSRNSYNGGWQ